MRKIFIQSLETQRTRVRDSGKHIYTKYRLQIFHKEGYPTGE